MNLYNQKIQPIIRLVPQQPLTNSRLMIYCSTSDKIPINFQATWARVNPITLYTQQIKNHQGSCYQCSPLDFNYIIQATIYYDEKPGTKNFKKASFPPVKLNRQLQQRQLYVMQPMNCKMRIQQIVLDCKMIPKYQCLNINSNGYRLQLPLGDFTIQMRQNCLSFIIIIQNRYQDLLNFISRASNISMKYCTRICQFIFNNRIDRDVVILSIAQDNRRNSTSSMKSNSSQRTPRKDIILNTSVNRDKSDKSLSINKKKDPNGKIKISQRVQKKNNFNNYNTNNNNTNTNNGLLLNSFTTNYNNYSNFNNSINNPTSLSNNISVNTNALTHNNIFLKNQQFINIYEQQKPSLQRKNNTNTSSKADLVAMDLRQSFAQFQQNSFIKDQRSSDNSNRPGGNDKKMEEQNKSLKQENKKLRQQIQSMSTLAKQNVTLRKKYHQLSQQINRLQFQRKQILQDKLRFQANYHKQVQEKQQYKKQIESLKQQLALSNFDKKDNSQSPFKKQSLHRPVTPDRSNGSSFNDYKYGSK